MGNLGKNLQLLLFLLENSKKIKDMTEMKVYKLLYFLDKEFYKNFGQKILDGITKNIYGPVVASLKNELFFDNFIKLKEKDGKNIIL